MSYYRVNFGDYSLAHYDSCKYLNYFEFNGKKYKIGSYVKVADKGMLELFYSHGCGYNKDCFRLVDHFFTEKGYEQWEYIIGHLYDSKIPVLHTTSKRPEELISEVLSAEIDETMFTPGELKVTFNEPNLFPKDWEVEGVMFGWFMLVLVWIGALIFKDWWLKLLIQIGAGLYFGNWREQKINKAIETQKFKK